MTSITLFCALCTVLLDDPQTALIKSVRAGDLARVKAIVESNPEFISNVDSRSEKRIFRCGPLHWAAMGGHDQIVRYLIEKGYPVDARDNGDRTAVSFAVQNNHVKVVEYLLDQNADVNAESSHQYLLDYAAKHGHLDCAKLLIDRGARINANNALALAIIGRHEQLALYLLERGADPNGIQAMKTAAEFGSLKLLKEMVSRGGDVNTPGYYGGALALATRSVDLTEFFVQQGADVNGSTKGGITPLFKAAQLGATKSIEYLIDHGATVDFHCHNQAGGGAPFRPIHSAIQSGHTEVCRLLLRRGARPDLMTAIAVGNTAQIKSFVRDSPETLQQFLPSTIYENALSVALKHRQHASLQTLLELGADASEVNQHYAPLHIAAQMLDTNALQILLAAGADPNVRSHPHLFVHANATPLLMLVDPYQTPSAEHLEKILPSAKVLLKGGADPDQVPRFGPSFRKLVSKSKDPELVELLKANP